MHIMGGSNQVASRKKISQNDGFHYTTPQMKATFY